MTFLDKLLGSKPPTSDALKEAIAKLDLAAERQTMELIEQERKQILINGTDEALASIDAKLAKARTAFDRVRAQHEELARKILEAERKEAIAAFNAERDSIEAEAAEAAVALRRDYPKLAQKLADLVTRVQAADKKVRLWNHVNIYSASAERLEEHGASPIDQVQTRVFDGYNPEGYHGGIPEALVLPFTDPEFAPHLNDDRIAKLHGQRLFLRRP